MSDTIEEFDHDKYTGQVHAWKYQDGTFNGEPRTKLLICRRYTAPDDTEWGCWIQLDGDDKDTVVIKLLHFCSYLNYEVLSHRESCDAPEDYKKLQFYRESDEIYNTYKSEADKADTFVEGIGEEVHEELSSLFASFSTVQKLGLDCR